MYKVEKKTGMAHHRRRENVKKIPLMNPLANVPKPRKPKSLDNDFRNHICFQMLPNVSF